jgi:hypothetical protein
MAADQYVVALVQYHRYALYQDLEPEDDLTLQEGQVAALGSQEQGMDIELHNHRRQYYQRY